MVDRDDVVSIIMGFTFDSKFWQNFKHNAILLFHMDVFWFDEVSAAFH